MPYCIFFNLVYNDLRKTCYGKPGASDGGETMAESTTKKVIVLTPDQGGHPSRYRDASILAELVEYGQKQVSDT